MRKRKRLPGDAFAARRLGRVKQLANGAASCGNACARGSGAPLLWGGRGDEGRCSRAEGGLSPKALAKPPSAREAGRRRARLFPLPRSVRAAACAFCLCRVCAALLPVGQCVGFPVPLATWVELEFDPTESFRRGSPADPECQRSRFATSRSPPGKPAGPSWQSAAC